MKQFTQGGSCTGVNRGFALPTILIASVVMLIVLLAAVQTIVVSRLSVEEQYYNRLASEAAESGLVTAKECIRADSSYSVSWSASTPLDTGDDCMGEPIDGADQTVVTSVSPIKIETSYSIAYPTNPAQNPVTIEAIGTVALKRKSDDSVWKSYTASKKMTMSRGTQVAQQVASGSSVNCGIFDQETWCWGLNDRGQLGRGTTGGTELTPARMVREAGGLLGKKDKLVAVGSQLSCVVTTDSKVFCSGLNSYYQMGTGTVADGGSFTSNKPYPVDLTNVPNGATITDIAAGRNFVCIVASGNVYCWGRNIYGNLGIASTNTRPTTRVGVIGQGTTPGAVTKIATTWGADHACAIAGSPGRVYCWGRNTRGQLGNGSTTTTSSTPVAVTTAAGVMAGKNIIDIAVAGGGNQGASPSYSDGCVSPGESATAGACGTSINNIWEYMRATSCAVAQTGEVYCWGSNNNGQLGQRTTPTPGSSVPYFASTTPVRAGGATPLTGVTQVSLSYGTVCAMTGTGAPTGYYCWGSNTHGALGRGLHDNPTTGGLAYSTNPEPPQILPGALQGKVITKISGGVNRQCAIANGISYCWGYNNSGQIGDGTVITRTTPTESKILRQFDEEPTFY